MLYRSIQAIGGDSNYLFVSDGLEGEPRLVLTPVDGVISGSKMKVIAAKESMDES